MYSGRPAADKVLIARVIIAFLCLVVCGIQIYSGISIIQSNTAPLKEIVGGDYSSISADEEIQGTIDNIIYEYEGDTVLNGVDVRYYLSKTADDRVISFRAVSGSGMDSQLRALHEGSIESIEYRGLVHAMKDMNKGFLNMQMTADRTLSLNDIEGGTQKAIMPYVIDITEKNDKINDKYVVFTFIGAALMLVICFFVIKKPVKLFVESLRSRNGTYVPERQVVLEDLTFENEGYYEGMKEGDQDFFVNTEYNIRNEGDTNAIKRKREKQEAAGEDSIESIMKKYKFTPAEEKPMTFYSGYTEDDDDPGSDEKTGGYRRRY